MKFKSINRQLKKSKKAKYVFMNFIKEYSDSELKAGKTNVYARFIKDHANFSYGERIVHIYLKDNTGFHYINTKKKRVKYLGKTGNDVFNSLKNRLKLSFFANNTKDRQASE